jgi:hypothetical protein
MRFFALRYYTSPAAVTAAGFSLLAYQGNNAMRLWSLHPRYLDRQGLVALWREALLAQAVLHGTTSGYRNHPQLDRFKRHPEPQRAIAAYLLAVAGDARQRGYAFDVSRIAREPAAGTIAVTRGQLNYEWRHLLDKLRVRSPRVFETCACAAAPEPHPFFSVVDGEIEPWEKFPTTYTS